MKVTPRRQKSTRCEQWQKSTHTSGPQIQSAWKSPGGLVNSQVAQPQPTVSASEDWDVMGDSTVGQTPGYLDKDHPRTTL